MRLGAPGINVIIQRGQTTTCRLLKVTRLSDGQIFGFTDHDEDITYSSQLYLSTTSFEPFNQADHSDAAASDTEMTGAFDQIITRADVLAELWNNSTFQLLRINWDYPADGAIILMTGSFGEFEPQEFGFKVALHSLEFPLTFVGGEICGPTCRVDFGSPKCAPGGVLDDGTTIASLVQIGTVTGTDGFSTIAASGLTDTGKPFDGGLISWATGLNTNLCVEVLHIDFGSVTISLRPWTQIAAIALGDTFSLFPACDKRFETCVQSWNNAVNFQGEPHVPGPDPQLAYPDYFEPTSTLPNG
jgi:uncharacterized phage protein (TIGR02218 family)